MNLENPPANVLEPAHSPAGVRTDADPGGRRSCVIQSVIGPDQLWREIRHRHFKSLSPTEARVLAYVLQGYGSEHTATLMEVTAATVRRHVADLCHGVFDLTEIPQDRNMLRTWAGEHLDCCMPLVREMIENDRKFA